MNHAYVIGVGSKNGGKIPNTTTKLNDLDDINSTDSSTKQSGKWIIDPSTGKPGISKMDPQNLKNIADEISGKYVDSSKNHSIGLEAKIFFLNNGDRTILLSRDLDLSQSFGLLLFLQAY